MVIKAKYEGVCKECGGRIDIGQEIEWERGEGARHVECPAHEKAPHVLRMSSSRRCHYTKGHVIRNRKGKTPEYLTVVRTKSEYIPEDGMSFGLMDESGYLWTVYCREATTEEAAPLIEEAKKQQKMRVAQKRIAEIKKQIQDNGEKPEGDNALEGERFIDKQDIYGGGDWFAIDSEHIWYIKNNGRDGDMWDLNNVRTGGAGAIGWRVPMDEGLAAEIRRLAEVLGKEE